MKTNIKVSCPLTRKPCLVSGFSRKQISKLLPPQGLAWWDHVSGRLYSLGSHMSHVVSMSQYWVPSGNFRQLSWTEIKHFIFLWIWDMKHVFPWLPYQHKDGFWRASVVTMQNWGNIKKHRKKNLDHLQSPTPRVKHCWEFGLHFSNLSFPCIYGMANTV